jgi:hypothetical protein
MNFIVGFLVPPSECQYSGHKRLFPHPSNYVGLLISLWLFVLPIFLFAAQPKEFFLERLKKLEQRSHKCVELRGEYVE